MMSSGKEIFGKIFTFIFIVFDETNLAVLQMMLTVYIKKVN